MNNRLFIALVSLGIGAISILLMSFLPNKATEILLDKGSDFFPFPLTVQNVMWLAFFAGFGECFVRYKAIKDEYGHLENNYLQVGKKILSNGDISAIHAQMKPLAHGVAYLPRLIYRCAQTLLMSGSQDSAMANVNSNSDLYAHSIDLRYTVLRYLTWLIPTLGFLGTCIGIAIALNYAADANLQDPTLLSNLSLKLGVAFYTTFLALLQSAVLVLIMNILQAKEEMCLNIATQYCLDNLVGRYKDG